MELSNAVALVTGGASGLGAATAAALQKLGAKVVIADMPTSAGAEVAKSLNAVFVPCDVTNDADVASLVKTAAALGALRIVVNCAGIAPACKVLGKQGLHPLSLFEKTLAVNVVGTFNVIRHALEVMQHNAPQQDQERGVIINTSSVAAYEGQLGQAAYSASKGAIVGMNLPLARELASLGIRVMTIAPGIFETPMLAAMPQEVQDSLGKMVPFPQRLGKPDEYAKLVCHIVENRMLNGEVIRLDGAIRMQAR